MSQGDVAAMGAYEFVFGDATTGQIYHNNLTKYHTQKMLYEGQNELIYGKGMEGKPKATLKAVASPSFKVISSNITGISSVSMSPCTSTRTWTRRSPARTSFNFSRGSYRNVNLFHMTRAGHNGLTGQGGFPGL